MAKFFNLISLIIVTFVFIVLANVLQDVDTPADTSSDISSPVAITLSEPNPLMQSIIQAYLDRDYIAALELIDKNESNLIRQAESDAKLGLLFFHLKGHVHAAIWQHVEAEQSWRKALTYTNDKHLRNSLVRLIKTRQSLIQDIGSERIRKAAYHASPNVGPAAVLKGRIVVIYIFVTDSAMQNWSMRRRDQVMQNWGGVENWLKARTMKYDSDLDFKHRLFVIDKNPYIKRLRVGDFDRNYLNSNKVAHLVVQQLGYDNMMSFISEIKYQEKADQAILLLHLARDGRSFASRCMNLCSTDAEYVFLMEKPVSKSWQSMGYAQAHESLHLFGADDLYNIEKARYYAVRDIMNYPSSILNASTLDEITAYATGLTDKKPEAPFKVIDYLPGRE